jgi:hypothetical protein
LMLINSITKGKNLIGNKSLVYFNMIATDLFTEYSEKKDKHQFNCIVWFLIRQIKQ